MTPPPVDPRGVAGLVPQVAVDRVADGWSFAYEPATRFIALNHPRGGKQSAMEIRADVYGDEYGHFIAACLNAAGSIGEPVAWLRDRDDTGSLHPAAAGDPGAFPVYDALAASPVSQPTVGGEAGYSARFPSSGGAWSRYPMGTRAYAFDGGYWQRVEHGWKWQNGSTFPTPGASAYEVAVPAAPTPPASVEPVSQDAEDAARLDWLANNADPVYGTGHEMYYASVTFPMKDSHEWRGQAFRAAIDAARKEKGR